MAYEYSRVSEVERTPGVYTDVRQYPSENLSYNKKVVYEEEEVPRHHHHHHHLLGNRVPETRERVEVTEYETADNYGTRDVIYENVGVETDQRYPRRTYNTYRP